MLPTSVIVGGRRVGESHAAGLITYLHASPRRSWATEPVATAAREAMSSAVELSSYLCAALLAAALLATLFMRPSGVGRPD